MTNKVEYGDYILYLETIHGNVLQKLSESLKDMIADVNITFNQKTFCILRMNDDHSLLVYLQMFAEEFNEYYIAEPFVAGISFPMLLKALKTMPSGNMLRLTITKTDPNVLKVQFFNSEETITASYKVPLLDLNEDDIAVPDLEFTFMITMNSGKFQNIIRNLKSINVESLKITYSKEGLEFEGTGDFPAHYILKKEDNIDIVTNDQVEGALIYQGIVEVDKLSKFTKCTSLSEQVKILLMNDYPLVFIYDVGGQGEIKLCLAPNNPEE